MTLKILNYIAKRNGCSIKELCEVFNIARQNIHYHIRKLLELGKIERLPHNAKKHDPTVIYRVKSCNLETTPFFNGASQKAGAFKIFKKSRPNFIASQIIQILRIKPQTPKMLREKLKIPKRSLSYYISKLIKAGIITRAGGRCCKYAYLILNPSPVHIEHSHKYTKYHRYHKNRRRKKRKIPSRNYFKKSCGRRRPSNIPWS
jgi:DNA-binding MarR family transcriptional regulator